MMLHRYTCVRGCNLSLCEWYALHSGIGTNNHGVPTYVLSKIYHVVVGNHALLNEIPKMPTTCVESVIEGWVLLNYIAKSTPGFSASEPTLSMADSGFPNGTKSNSMARCGSSALERVWLTLYHPLMLMSSS